MKWLSTLWRRFRNWRTPPYRPLQVEDMPDSLDRQILYLIGDEQPWQAAMLCPCGCNSTIQLSLVPDDSPRWRAMLHDKETVSLSPSVWRTRGCGAHFILARNRVHWC